MAITRTPMVDDDGTGEVGTVINNAWKTELYDQIDGAILGQPGIGGVWQQVPFNAANFQWAGVTAGHVTVNQFTVINKTMLWMVQIAAAPGSGGTYLYLTIPNNTVNVLLQCVSPIASGSDGGTFINAHVTVGNTASVAIVKSTAAAWAGPVYCYFTAILALQ